jgi:hypothetical protein
MWNEYSHFLVAYIILSLSTLGVALYLSKFLKYLDVSVAPWFIPPAGFVVLFSIVVLLRIGQPVTRIPMGQILLVVTALYGLWKLLAIGFLKLRAFVSNTWFGIAPYIIFSVASTALRGGLPFSVSDAWTHISYINRLSASESTMILGSHLPTDGKYFSFSPTSIFLSTLNDVSGSDAIATWNAAKWFLGVLLICASTAFLVSLKIYPNHKKSFIAIVSTAFVLIYPTADLVEGWAGYSMTGSIFLFMCLTLAIQCSTKEFQLRSAILFGLVGLVMSINHPIESVLCLLMMIPLVVLPQIIKPQLFKTIFGFLMVSLVGGLITSRVLNSQAAQVLNFSGAWPGFHFFSVAIKPFFDGRVVLALMCSVIYLLQTKRSVASTYFFGSIATLIVLGPWNPLFYSWWVKIMSSTLLYRAIFVLPLWIVFGTFTMAYLEDFLRIGVKKIHRLLFGLLLFGIFMTSIGFQLGHKFGFTGQLTYYGSDEQSQLATLPNLYTKIQSFKGKVFLADTWTGAPIPAISSNYIVVHRPWTPGPDSQRWEIGRETMKHLYSPSSQLNMCNWGVDYVLLNESVLPLMVRQFRAAPWLLPDFYSSQRAAYPDYLKSVEDIDSVKIIKFDKKLC